MLKKRLFSEQALVEVPSGIARFLHALGYLGDAEKGFDK